MWQGSGEALGCGSEPGSPGVASAAADLAGAAGRRAQRPGGNGKQFQLRTAGRAYRRRRGAWEGRGVRLPVGGAGSWGRGRQLPASGNGAWSRPKECAGSRWRRGALARPPSYPAQLPEL